MKNVIKSIMLGTAWGCTVNCVVSMIIAFAQGGLSYTPSEYLTQIICSVIVGIGFVVPTLVYRSERLPQAVKCIIHLGIGFTVYIPTAFFAGWIPTEAGIGVLITTIISILISSFIIYLCMYIYYRNEVRRMNDKIKEKNIG